MEAETDFAGACSFARMNTKKLGDELKNIIDFAKKHPEIEGLDKGEMIENATLAYRHCEDVSMRLGKAIQAFEGGKNIYDNNDAIRHTDDYYLWGRFHTDVQELNRLNKETKNALKSNQQVMNNLVDIFKVK